MRTELTTTQLLRAASEILTDSGYGEAPAREDLMQAFATRVFEDRYGIVAVCVFDSWEVLCQDWPVAQGQLAEAISETVLRSEPKAWEGYLVLMTPGGMPRVDRTLLNRLRADTNRVRKLVAAGEELGTLEDVRTFLLPLVPLTMGDSLPSVGDLLHALPELLLAQGVRTQVTETVLDAFGANESVFQRLHDSGST